VPAFPRKPDVQRPRGEVNPARIASARVVFGEFIVYQNATDPEQDIEGGDNIAIKFPNPTGGTIYHKLTTLTSEELEAVKMIFDLAFSLAAPICKERDRVAAESADRGEDLYSRNYRAKPHVIVKRSVVAPEKVAGE